MNMKEPAGSDPNRLFFGKIKKEADLKSVSSLYSFGPAECLEAVLNCLSEGYFTSKNISNNSKTASYSEYSAKSDFEAPQTGHFQSLGMSLNGVPGFMPPSGSPSAGS